MERAVKRTYIEGVLLDHCFPIEADSGEDDFVLEAIFVVDMVHVCEVVRILNQGLRDGNGKGKIIWVRTAGGELVSNSGILVKSLSQVRLIDFDTFGEIVECSIEGVGSLFQKSLGILGSEETVFNPIECNDVTTTSARSLCFSYWIR